MAAAVGVPSSGAPVVDVHTHLVPRGWPDLGAACGGSDWPWLRLDSERDAMIMVGERSSGRSARSAGTPRLRLADMDADGVDVQVVSPTPLFFSYDRPADQAVEGGPDLQRPDPGDDRRRRRSG